MDEFDDALPPAAAGAAGVPPPPRSVWEFLGFLAPVAKYYVALMVIYFAARWFNNAVDAEADLKDKERERPDLTRELMRESSSEEEESSSEDEEEEDEPIEELVTDGSRLVSVGENKPAGVKKSGKKSAKNASKELFDGLRKVEQELRERKEKGEEEGGVSWNDLHSSMLKRYKDKYPNHGPRVAENDDYDDEFKELLRKNNIDPDELKSSKTQGTTA